MKGLVNASSVFLDNNVLVEVACENNGECDVDQRAFKGITARSLARAALSAAVVAESINTILQTSAKGAASACSGSGEDVSCKFSWAESDSQWETASAKDGNLGEVFDALEVVQALLYPQAKAIVSGDGQGSGSGNGDATQSGGASGTSGAASPQQTGAAGTTVASITAAFAVVFAVVLSY